MSTFTWNPDTGATMDREPRIRSAQFGDGYQQRALDGLNADLRTFSLSFSGRALAESQAIVTFLETVGGVTSFDYTHPGDTSRKYICKSWKRTDAAYNLQTVTATFQEVPL